MNAAVQPPALPAGSPFHAGEEAVQARLGVQASMAKWGRKVVRPWMPDQHRAFYEQLPFIVAAARDASGRPWVTLLTGKPGFVHSSDARTLELNLASMPGNPLQEALAPGAELGLLGIELDTRRRNRVNGRITAAGDGALRFMVRQSFGNCPQYITERAWHWQERPASAIEVGRHRALTPSMQAWVRASDTFFIGSGKEGSADDESTGMDASHRGGPPGFVEVAGATRLVFPDYAGNNHFNTIGNLLLDPRVALLFVDFDTGGLLHVSGRAEIDFDSAAGAERAGAQRLVSIEIDDIVLLENALPLRFTRPGLAARTLRLVEKQRESADVTSFYLAARDGGDLPAFVAGQHLPVTLDIAGDAVTRTYSLSNGPDQGVYRISVKREPRGLVSRHLHDHVHVGQEILTAAPAGDFVLADGDRPVVLISAGVGITPMMAMLHELTRAQSRRPVHFLHGARNGRHHPFRKEIEDMTRKHGNVTVVTAYSQPDAADRQFDHEGRIDEALIRASVQDLNADFYVCGPGPFLAAMTDVLGSLGVADRDVHVESF